PGNAAPGAASRAAGGGPRRTPTTGLGRAADGPVRGIPGTGRMGARGSTGGSNGSRVWGIGPGLVWLRIAPGGSQAQPELDVHFRQPPPGARSPAATRHLFGLLQSAA